MATRPRARRTRQGNVLVNASTATPHAYVGAGPDAVPTKDIQPPRLNAGGGNVDAYFCALTNFVNGAINSQTIVEANINFGVPVSSQLIQIQNVAAQNNFARGKFPIRFDGLMIFTSWVFPGDTSTAPYTVSFQLFANGVPVTAALPVPTIIVAVDLTSPLRKVMGVYRMPYKLRIPYDEIVIRAVGNPPNANVEISAYAWRGNACDVDFLLPSFPGV